MGSRTTTAAISTVLSRIAGTPSGRCFPPVCIPSAREVVDTFGFSALASVRPTSALLRMPPGLPVLRQVPICLHAIANTPAGPMEPYSLELIHQLRPSLDPRRVGSCITRFGACTAFKFVTAYRLAKSPERPSTPEASAASFPPLLLRLLPGGANQFPGGICTHCGPAPFTAHAEVGLATPPKPL